MRSEISILNEINTLLKELHKINDNLELELIEICENMLINTKTNRHYELRAFERIEYK